MSLKRFAFFHTGDATYGYDLSVGESLRWSIYEFIVAIAALCVLFGLFVVFVPIILFVLYFFWEHRERWIINLMIIASSIYIICDYHYGWVAYHVWSMFFNGLFNIFFTVDLVKFFYLLVSINTGILITNVILLLTNNAFMKVETESKNIAILIFTFFVFIVSGVTLHSTIGGYNHVVDKYQEIEIKSLLELERYVEKETIENDDYYWRNELKARKEGTLTNLEFYAKLNEYKYNTYPTPSEEEIKAKEEVLRKPLVSWNSFQQIKQKRGL